MGLGIRRLLKYNNASWFVSPCIGDCGRLCMSDLRHASGENVKMLLSIAIKDGLCSEQSTAMSCFYS